MDIELRLGLANDKSDNRVFTEPVIYQYLLREDSALSMQSSYLRLAGVTVTAGVTPWGGLADVAIFEGRGYGYRGEVVREEGDCGQADYLYITRAIEVGEQLVLWCHAVRVGE